MGGRMNFPIVRKTISEINLPKAKSITLNCAVLGTLPSRLMMVIVPNSILYGDKEWPKKDGLEFINVPDNEKRSEFTDDEIDQIVRSNVDAYATMREVFTPSTYLHKMAVTPNDYFKYNFVMSVDLSSLAQGCLNPDTREPRYEGDLTIKMDFNHMLGENDPMMLIICAEHKNQITWH
ncbi:hypothetical protein CAPTEDRAFT_214353 [Capitella teleta]|uniref:Uncharacterized protein n=1 Tax=Capitella teleta TaxID=283909 RepID=R7VCE8_CAPTE|nr:hypothetical protein CAPTEDRAFT_214353 [Capitella teleta]|eukprot:ELU16299.1 hypothetical protein CAPTEDRAFT_214353 [Capitella teleta]